VQSRTAGAGSAKMFSRSLVRPSSKHKRVAGACLLLDAFW
jgi:hypothetical protein